MQVRLFAALRDAAGTSVVDVEATTVAELLAELATTHGEPMTSRLATATVFVDELAIRDPDSTHDLTDADEVVVVPPFAGG
ncbi:MAG TPA: MoaD/ThiS family protein [Nitriliruptoraceae bacterium]|nr:MoaD/ThiS family protein [Nitriliruptoraceae bacterium]